MKLKYMCFIGVLVMAVNTSYAESQSSWGFDTLALGGIPENWEISETNGIGNLAIWEVQLVEEDKAFGIKTNRNKSKTTNLVLIKVEAVKNVELSARIHAGSIGNNAGGGLIWRVVDENHYYFVQWDPIGKNCRLYLTIGGKSSLLESVNVDADISVWHQLDVVHNEELIEVLFDGDSILEFEDGSLDLPGWIGLLAPGDAMPSFDDVTFYTEGN